MDNEDELTLKEKLILLIKVKKIKLLPIFPESMLFEQYVQELINES